MNMPDDARLKQCFQSLREHDQRAAPDFLNTVSAGEAAAGRRRRSRNWMAAAAMLLFVAAAGLMMTNGSRRSSVRTAAAAGPLLSWSSPTAFLLEPLGKQLLDRDFNGSSRRKESK